MVDDFSITCVRTSYRYIFPVNSIDEADGDSWISFDVENLDLNEPAVDQQAAMSPARLDARSLVHATSIARSRHEAFTINAQSIGRLTQRLDGRATSIARLRHEAFTVGAQGVARADVRGSVGHGLPTRFDARSLSERLLSARFDARNSAAAFSLARLCSRSIVARVQLGRHHAFVPPGWSLVARNAATGETIPLGFIDADADPKQLVDAPLPDGVWEIDARPSEWFWDDTRGRRAITLVIGEVGGDLLGGLPFIQDLRREIGTTFKITLRWRVAGEYGGGDFDFGLWFSPTSPVDTSGDPDQTIPHFSGQGDYAYTHVQTDEEFVAVAAFTDTDMGPVSELELPWESDAPISPPNQLATWEW